MMSDQTDGHVNKECTIFFSLAQTHFTNRIIHCPLKITLGQIDASRGLSYVRLRAIKSSEEECQTHHCQPQSKNIGDIF